MPKLYVQTHGEDVFEVGVVKWGKEEASMLQDELSEGSGWVRIGNDNFLASSIKRVTTSKPIEK